MYSVLPLPYNRTTSLYNYDSEIQETKAQNTLTNVHYQIPVIGYNYDSCITFITQ